MPNHKACDPRSYFEFYEPDQNFWFNIVFLVGLGLLFKVLALLIFNWSTREISIPRGEIPEESIFDEKFRVRNTKEIVKESKVVIHKDMDLVEDFGDVEKRQVSKFESAVMTQY